jgi:O-antigen/teichoic acid export membrane protein
MLKRVLNNFGVVLRGRGIAAVFSVTATGLMANALSATEFGLVILLHTYIMVVRGALNFRTYETIIRFGIPLVDAADDSGLRSLLRSTMMIDMAAALLAVILGGAAASLAGHFLQWDNDMVAWAAMYSLIILTTANSTPDGILRIYNRFDALGVQATVGPALRLVMVFIAWVLDAGMPVFILVWGTAFAAGHIYT